jgi:hypothetical protein
MSRRSLPEDCVLARTPEGARRMRDRAAGLPARLRSVLFLVDGSQPVRRILARAGQLGPLLEEQLMELLDMGLLEGAPRVEKVAAVPIVGAKAQLLTAFERYAGPRMKDHGSALVEARSWKDLASRARSLSLVIHEAAGTESANRFWAEAKEILVAYRGQETETVRS